MRSDGGRRLAISNIAWSPTEDEAIAAVLVANGVRGIEIAPTKWREDPFDAPAPAVASFKRRWADRGLEIVSLQSLLFGRPDLQLFGSESCRASLVEYMRKALDFAAAMGAHAIVFGSPKNRIRGDLALDRALDVARGFLIELAEHAQSRGVALCVEANPPAYGCDFITATAEAVALCRLVDHPFIRINGDLGGMTMAGEDPASAIGLANGWMGHFHASEPELAELGASADHARAASALVHIGYARWVSIEMRAALGGASNVRAVERAVRMAREAYGPPVP